MGNHRIHLVAVCQRSTQFGILLLNDALGSHERYLLHHTHHKFLLIERLRQEVAGTHLETVHQILRSIQRRQEDNGDILGLIVFLKDDCRIKTADIRHHNVKKDQVRMLFLGHFNTRSTVIGCTDLEFLIRQQYLQQKYIADHIIDNEYLILTSVYF